MGFIAAGAAIAGVGLAAAGTVTQIGAAKQSKEANQQIIAGQQRQEALRQQAMELDARRRQMEVLRNQQRARSIALASANNQGALFGSGLQGGYGQISGTSNTDALGVDQNLSLGRQNFGIQGELSQSKIALAGAQSQAAFGSSLSSLGGTLISSLGPISRLSQGVNFGGFSGSGGQVGTSSIYNKYS